ncbi:MAG: PHP domain-containing protein [Actinomycetes bacterium]
MEEKLSIAQVTPFAWELPSEVNEFVGKVSDELASRGHRVAIIAPSTSAAKVRDGRRLIRSSKGDLLEGASDGPLLVAVGQSLEAAPGRRRLALPSDTTRTLGSLFEQTPLDICHLHEPFAPSITSAALRASNSLNVGSFHAPAERLVATQVTRRLVRALFGRLDARTASYLTTARMMEHHFPAEYQLIAPGAPALEREHEPAGANTPLRIVFIDEEERSALRLLLRSLRLIKSDRPWELVVSSSRGRPATPLRAEIAACVSYVDPSETATDELLASADIVVGASAGALPQPGMLARAGAAGAAVVASRLAVYEEVIGDGQSGLLFTPRELTTLAAQISRLLNDTPLRERLGAATAPRSWEQVADQIEEAYETVVARRKPLTRDVGLVQKLKARPLIDVDLHMHTDHSHDCATPVEALLETARDRGLGAIAVTEHNEISGAVAAAAICEQYGVKVILAEEVKTANQGEVIGLFINEKIERGMTLAETVAEIKRQGGLVYVPHPFDRMHAIPDYEHLLPIVDQIDLIEIYNPRVALDSFNEEAARFAAKYRIPAAAGSDSHVTQGLGTARVRMRDFDGPEEFLESLRDAEIHSTPTNYVYVQALKFIQTKATPESARRASRKRKARKSPRKR